MLTDHFIVDNKEKLRVKALRACGVMHTMREEEYDAITQLATRICDMPCAYISFIDDEQQWVKSSVGFETVTSPRSVSFCHHTIISEEPYLEVYDTLLDERFFASPFVTEPPHYRYYAGFALIDEDGHRLGSLCVMDIKPRKLNEINKSSMLLLARQTISLISLRKQKLKLEEYSQLFNSSNEIHAILGTDARVLKVNNSVETILGYPRQWLAGKPIWAYCFKGDRISLRDKILSEIIAGKKFFEVETRMKRVDGENIWISWNANFIDEKWYISGRDITFQKKILGELNELSLVASSIKNGVVISDEDGRILWINHAFKQVIGYSLDDIKGKSLGDVICGEHTDQETVEYARKMARSRQSFEIDLLAYRKDGTPIWLSVINSTVAPEEGGPGKQIEIIVDITSRQKDREEILRAKEEAQQLNRAKDMFISVMSHEIRTPLNAVIGISRLLDEGEINDQQRENVQMLKFSAQNLMGLINDVLDLTKIETGNLKLEQANVDLRSLVKGIVLTQQFKTREKKIYLNSEIDDTVPKFIKGDQTRLYQILMNLVGNAVKFTSAGGVTVKISKAGENHDKISLRFEVIDTGIGIHPSKKDAIFEIFRQAESSTTRNYGGTGLGLPITKRLIELHHSSIHLESTPEQGSTFIFTISFPKSCVLEKNIPSTSKHSLDMDILVVDDNQINRMLVGKVLEKWGARADFAEDGETALKKIECTRYSAVLMDVNMPKMGGIEATRIIRKRNECNYLNLPVLALTASVMQDELREIHQAGMNDYILKPFEPEILFEKLKKYA